MIHQRDQMLSYSEIAEWASVLNEGSVMTGAVLMTRR